jgi:hypothetical protein
MLVMETTGRDLSRALYTRMDGRICRYDEEWFYVDMKIWLRIRNYYCTQSSLQNVL